MVVMVILTVLMAMVVPKGSKMLDSFQRSIQVTKDKQTLSKKRSLAFLQAKETTIDILGFSYHISDKGVMTKYEKSNDND